MPYDSPPYDLGVAILRPVSDADAATLGAGLAAIAPWARMGYPAAGLVAYLKRDDPAARRFGVWVEGQLAGTVAVREPWLRGPYLELLGLLPAAQGRGVGGRIMQWFEDEAGSIGNGRAANLWVLCSDFNSGALAFYRRHGFKQVVSLNNLAATGYAEILLRKSLNR